MTNRARFKVRWAILLVVSLNAIIAAQAQTGACRDEWPGFLVRSVEVKARWPPAISLPLERGKEFTPDRLSETRRAIIDAIDKERKRHNSEFVNMGALPLAGINFARACGRQVEPSLCLAEGLGEKCVDVEIHPFTLTIDALNFGSTLLPFPRSNKFSFLSETPRPLRVFNPKFSFAQDRELGAMPKFEMATDLVALPKLLKGEAADVGKTSVMLKAKGSLSLDESHYTSQSDLAFLYRQPSERIESVGVEARFTADRTPQQGAPYLNNAFRIGAHIAFNPAAGLVNRVVLNAGYRRSSNRFFGAGARPVILTAENSFDGRVLMEGRLLDGFTRLALWADGGRPSATPDSYRRVAGMIGYEKEIPVGGDHTLGVEALFGMGLASDKTPEYARFYGGNLSANFLYDDSNDSTLVALPTGPLLRSFGRNQAGAPANGEAQGGGASYQHFNLTVSVPIPPLSRPLIPNERVTANATLRTLIKDFAIRSGKNALSVYFQDEGMDEEAANKKAEKIIDEVRPGVKYLADYAKIFAIRPLAMFDEARLARTGGGASRTRYAIGGGLQLIIVVAKFEAGYVRAVRGVEGDRRGNFIARIVFQNLF